MCVNVGVCLSVCVCEYMNVYVCLRYNMSLYSSSH